MLAIVGKWVLFVALLDVSGSGQIVGITRSNQTYSTLEQCEADRVTLAAKLEKERRQFYMFCRTEGRDA